MKKRIGTIILTLLWGILGGFLAFYLFFNFAVDGQRLNVYETIRERNVYIEESELTNVVEDVSAAVVAIVPAAEVVKFEKVSGLLASDCLANFSEDDCAISRVNGVMVSNDGLVVFPALEGDELLAYGSDDQRFSIEVLMNAEGLTLGKLVSDGEVFSIVDYADLNAMKVGQKVVSVAYNGRERSGKLAENIVSNIGIADIYGVQSVDQSVNQIGLAEDFEADFAKGPIFNLSGQLVGFNVDAALLDVVSVENLVQKQLDQKSGEELNWGVSFLSVNKNLALDYGLTVDHGALLISGIVDGQFELNAIEKDGIAEKIGLQSGDIVLEVDRVVVTSGRPLDRLLKAKAKGDKIRVKLLRNGTLVDIEGVL